MKPIPYSYTVLRYVQDPGAGEMLNVGVVLYVPSTHQLLFRFESRFQRLSEAFSGFSGEQFRSAIARLNSALTEIAEEPTKRPLLASVAGTGGDVLDMLRRTWLDAGLSLRFSPSLGGVTRNPERELQLLFERMVSSRWEKREAAARRTDEQVWTGVYESALSPEVRSRLQPKVFETSDFEYAFEHAFKNGAWHVIEPVSMDYMQADSIQQKASKLVGAAVGLENAPGLARIYFLLGAPRNSGQTKAYEKAKRLLDKAPIPHTIVEEFEAVDFATELQALVESSDH